MKKLYDLENDQTAIAQALKRFKNESQRIAILWSAMNYLKKNGKASISEALEFAEVEFGEE